VNRETLDGEPLGEAEVSAGPLEIEKALGFEESLISTIKRPALVRSFELQEASDCGAERRKNRWNHLPESKVEDLRRGDDKNRDRSD